MKIMLITEQIHKIGGIEKVLSLKIKYWLESGYEICLVTTENKNKHSFFTMPETLRWFDLKIEYDRDRSLTNLVNLKKAIKHIFCLRKTIKEEKPDVVINCCYGYDFFFLPFVKGKSKIVHEMHSSNLYSQRTPSLLSLFKKSLKNFFERKYDALIALSEEERRSYKLKNTFSIPNPVEVSNVQIQKKRRNIVISAGRLVPVKGFDRLVNIWGEHIGSDINWELHIYGDSDDADYIKLLNDLIEEKSLQNVVKIFPPSDNLLDKMRESKIYALPSRSECFPMVLLESLSIGLPVVSFDCPSGPRNIIENKKSGFIVEDNNELEFAKVLLSLINNEALRDDIGEGALLKGNSYSINNVMQQWDVLFKHMEVN